MFTSYDHTRQLAVFIYVNLSNVVKQWRHSGNTAPTITNAKNFVVKMVYIKYMQVCLFTLTLCQLILCVFAVSKKQINSTMKKGFLKDVN